MTKRPVGLMWYFVSSSSRWAGNDRLNHMLQNPGAKFVVGHGFGVLRGDDHGVDAENFSVRIIFNCDLGFAVGPEEGKSSVLANLREPHGQLMCE